ncbi:hypothetical protein M569_10914 [Genlisea aurea]|uniref:Uncharacterized protein n=1 Tax=Genlisea aurea TaxID=192259 RepID=S8CAF3_9LAMI|nr:hypothetical protein M569_10914 [Genlisea aurea]
MDESKDADLAARKKGDSSSEMTDNEAAQQTLAEVMRKVMLGFTKSQEASSNSSTTADNFSIQPVDNTGLLAFEQSANTTFSTAQLQPAHRKSQ